MHSITHYFPFEGHFQRINKELFPGILLLQICNIRANSNLKLSGCNSKNSNSLVLFGLLQDFKTKLCHKLNGIDVAMSTDSYLS